MAEAIDWHEYDQLKAQGLADREIARRWGRMVKIFELAFPLEVTSLPSPALRLVFRSTLTHTQRQ